MRYLFLPFASAVIFHAYQVQKFLASFLGVFAEANGIGFPSIFINSLFSNRFPGVGIVDLFIGAGVGLVFAVVLTPRKKDLDILDVTP